MQNHSSRLWNVNKTQNMKESTGSNAYGQSTASRQQSFSYKSGLNINITQTHWEYKLSHKDSIYVHMKKLTAVKKSGADS